MRIYLDDKRLAPVGWTRTYTAKQTIKYLDQDRDIIDQVSLDHDLGEGAGDGYEVLVWIEKEVYMNSDYIPPEIIIHSANPAAKKRMLAAVKTIKRELEKRG